MFNGTATKLLNCNFLVAKQIPASKRIIIEDQLKTREMDFCECFLWKCKLKQFCDVNYVFDFWLPSLYVGV